MIAKIIKQRQKEPPDEGESEADAVCIADAVWADAVCMADAVLADDIADLIESAGAVIKREAEDLLGEKMVDLQIPSDERGMDPDILFIKEDILIYKNILNQRI